MTDGLSLPAHPVAPTGSPPDRPQARIVDRGYRAYRGPRTGVRGAVLTVWRQSVQRALGIRRSAWTKVLPLASIAISYVPAIVFIGLVALLPDSEVELLDVPSYGEYFPFIQSALILFVAFVGPEILCPDRRTGMLGIYLASPLRRDTYLLAKALATAAVLALVTIGPPLLMLVAYVIQGVGPDGPVAVATTLARIVGSGALLAVLFTAVSMGVSSLTDRKAFATAGLLLLILMSSFFVGVTVEAAELDRNLHAASLITGPFSLVELMHGETPSISGISLGAAVGLLLGWTVVGAVVCRTRYQMLQVTS